MSEKMYTKNFSKLEMACKCGKMCGTEMDASFMHKLQSLRDVVKIPLTITSGARCPYWNKTVGGAEKSRHVGVKGVRWAKAADIACRNSSQRFWIVSHAIKLNTFGGIGIADTFIHLDSRLQEMGKIWTY